MRVIVSDTPGTEHANAVRTAILYGYNGLDNKSKYPDIDISNDVVIMDGGWSSAVDYAKQHEEVVAIARSTSGIKYFIDKAKEVYPRVQGFVPMGSNAYVELFIFSEPEPPIIVTCGCGDDEIRNNTAYGNGLEFWDTDWTWYGGTDASSFANGWICGKMLRLYDELKKIYGEQATWWHARSLLRNQSWRIEANRPRDTNGEPVIWCKENGYGRPNLDGALDNMNTFVVEPDPYLSQVLLGNVGKITGIPLGSVKIMLQPVENAIEYVIIKNATILKRIKAQETLEFIDNLMTYGTYLYSYYAIGSTGQTKESSKIRVIYKKGNHPSIIYYNEEEIKKME
ncbi:MAG: hypothetical protein JETCAE03_33820 [Ignavibacteriaceae bacterium]|jgi:hypothetical protein|nr:MAG: hypothetical protein JETCAE03_33820 [Ignavibacteriaceae bacterium]